MTVRVVHGIAVINGKNGIALPPVVFGKDLIKGVEPIGDDLIIAWCVAGIVITPGLTGRQWVGR